MGRVFLFGTIQMANRISISPNSTINGVPIDSFGNSDSSGFNGVGAYVPLFTNQSITTTDEGGICGEPPTNVISSQNGFLDGDSYVFTNLSGFKQPPNRPIPFYKDPNIIRVFWLDGQYNSDFLYTLVYTFDCR